MSSFIGFVSNCTSPPWTFWHINLRTSLYKVNLLFESRPMIFPSTIIRKVLVCSMIMDFWSISISESNNLLKIKILLRHDRGVILGKINGIFKAKFLFLLFFDSMTFLILRYFFENQERDVEIQIVSTTFSVFMCRKWIITNSSSIFLFRFYTGILCAQPILCPLYKSHIYGSFNNSLFFLIIIF